jgi:hypothetical protein
MAKAPGQRHAAESLPNPARAGGQTNHVEPAAKHHARVIVPDETIPGRRRGCVASAGIEKPDVAPPAAAAAAAAATSTPPITVLHPPHPRRRRHRRRRR